MKKKCIVIAGPTAVGKTELSIRLAKELNGAVISADSMQVYKGMDIGSAKVRKEEMQGIEHYLIDELDPKEEFHVVRFQQMAKKAMDEIYDKGKLPIIAGGTGFYIQALLKDIDFTETGKETDIRSKYHEISEKEGAEKLYGLLKQKDPKAAEYIHPNNVKRVIRALEFFDETGECISEHNTQQSQKTSPYTYAYFVLNDDRAVLYDRINRRVDKMLDDGLLEEVTRLKEMGLKEDDISMKGIGYREFFPYFRGEISLEEVIEAVKADSRHFAKRQITWFKREKDAIWFDRTEYDNDNDRILAAMISKWKEIENESY
ncbi:MAG: tRNA (adenosine(37)-N6)-dimethylallyltransferase MiaA [Lachnospiraceae bacterium]|nr:tRNA (adenosine(37)-N6)-dimethylallyltransferase MiaA [Lachnospiraceae bacterium]MDY6220960.1 tRNA (adenosine(37)-N6)-dimethylallyltransferase MiaA [Candidatus Alectryocaccobium sp.]